MTEDASRATPRQRVVLMGTGPFAVPAFEAVRRDGHEIAAVVTRPLPPVRSRKAPPPAPVRSWAESHGLPIWAPDDINAPESVAHLESLDADLLVVCDYGQILKPEALGSTPLGGINLHGSLLPSYRGAAPVQRALLAGERDAGVTVIHMTPQLDGGPILAIRSTEIRPTETAGELEARLGEIGVEATLEAISLLASWDRGAPIGQPQERGYVTKAPRLKKSEGEIDWSKPSAAIDRHVRGMQPWPVAFTHVTLDPHKPPLRLAVKEVADTSTPRPEDAAPGQVIGGDVLRVVTGDGVVEVVRLQPAGRREMSGEDFMRGLQQPPESLRLGSPAAVS